MYNPDDSDSTFMAADGSRLISESSLMAPPSDSGHGDLSLSELSLRGSDHILNRPFSLLSRRDPAIPSPHAEREEDHAQEEETLAQSSSKAREEKLQNDLFILKKLNASFAAFNEALDATEGVNEKIAKQLAQTDALLNKYVEILYRSEDVSRLIFDEEWEGAEVDEEKLEQERQEAIDRARREEEERVKALKREQERIEREEQERREEEQRLEQEKKERLSARGGLRGMGRISVVTRSSTRGISSGPRASTTVRPSGSGLPMRRTTGPTTARGTHSSSTARGTRKT